MKKNIKKILPSKIYNFLRQVNKKLFLTKIQNKALSRENENINARMLFYSSFIKTNNLCFDVGANIGNRVKPLLNIGAKILAVEPQESCYKFLNKKFGKKIILITKGLGEKEDIKNFYLSDCDKTSSFSEEWIDSMKVNRFKDYQWDRVVKKEMTTLDNLISLYGKPAFIKIDVEGYELEVLKGLSVPIKMICFEYMVPEQKNKAIECISYIEKLDANIECNYCVGESTVFGFDTWISPKDMCELISTKKFIDTGWGDIYVRNKGLY